MSRSIVGAEVNGDKLLQHGLRQLAEIYSPRAPLRIMKRALRAGGAEILKEAKRNAPRHAGGLKRSLAVTRGRRIRKYPSGNLLAVLGPAWPIGAHGTIVERGTANRRTKSGANRGAMPANPFLEPAFHGKQAAALERIRAEVTKGLKREWKKYFKQYYATH